MNKSVNKVFLVGRLTRNPELRHTTTNKAVCAFGLATNRARTKDGIKREVTEIVLEELVMLDKMPDDVKESLDVKDQSNGHPVQV